MGDAVDYAAAAGESMPETMISLIRNEKSLSWVEIAQLAGGGTEAAGIESVANGLTTVDEANRGVAPSRACANG